MQPPTPAGRGRRPALKPRKRKTGFRPLLAKPFQTHATGPIVAWRGARRRSGLETRRLTERDTEGAPSVEHA